VLSNVITAWSWFGTNLLGVGLHSYGFTSGTAMWLGIFVASQVLFALIGMVPLRLWWSFRVPQRPMQALNVEPV
jgi:predicted benzoate:H+ symporter BenE